MRWITLSLVFLLTLSTTTMAHCGQCAGDNDGGDAAVRPDREGPGGHHAEHGNRPERGEEQARNGRRPQRGGGFAEALEAMNLTEEQIEAVKVTVKEHREAMRAFHEDNREAMEAIREDMAALHAAETRDEEAMKALREKMADLMAGGDALREQFEADLGETLTDDQVDVLLEAIRPQPSRGREGHGQNNAPRGSLAMLDHVLTGELALTDDQKAEIKAMLAEARDAQGEQQGPKGLRLARRVYSEVLTDAQRELLDAYKSAMIDGAALHHLDLTEEQTAALRELHRETRQGLAAATTAEETLAILAAAREAVTGDILTAQQVEELQASRQLADQMESLMALDFTEEQRKAMGELRRETGEALETADTAAERLEMLAEAMDTLRTDILTAEQREALDAAE